MTTRRSARLQALPTRELVDDRQDAPTEAVVKRAATRKAVNGEKAKRAVKASAGKSRAPGAGPGTSSAQPNAQISSLPPEVLAMVLHHITDRPSMSALGRTCKMFYSLMMPRLYGRIAVAAMFHAHIPKLIRALEPHLTIAQKKQLNKEGKYKGQQGRYPTGLNEKAKPICAGYVRQLVIGVADPGRKHKYIVDRYVEEALKNMENLEIVETRVLNGSISQSLASLASLKALSVFSNNDRAGDMAPLAGVKNLKHLNWENYETFFGQHTVLQSILRNSMSTLQSLTIKTSQYGHQFLDNLEMSLKASGAATNRKTGGNKHKFTALKSLALEGVRIDEEFINGFQTAFDFPHLRELGLTSINDPECLLYPYLTDVVTSYQGTTDVPLGLRTLSISMSDDDHMNTVVQKRTGFEATCRFISSFDTLTTLVISDYGQYKSSTIANPGLPRTLLAAIVKHKNLEALRIAYQGQIGGLEIPYLSAETVGAIVDGLPRLREFEFAPDEEQMDKIGQALLRGGSHLELVTCFENTTWTSSLRPKEPGVNIISGILYAFLSGARIDLASDASGSGFVWEDYYRLKQVSVVYKTWDVASAFAKRGKRAAKTERIGVDETDGPREVCYRLAPETSCIHVGYDPNFEWVAKVERDLR